MSFDLQLFNGDLVIQNGDLGTVQDTNKLVQDILKICLTPVGANPLQPWYGSFISRSLIGSSLSTDITLQIAQTQLQNAIQNLITLQQKQLKSYQKVSAAEHISSILSINVARNITDPRTYQVKIKVASKALTPITVPFTVLNI
jgi:phage gp46-like protein